MITLLFSDNLILWKASEIQTEKIRSSISKVLLSHLPNNIYKTESKIPANNHDRYRKTRRK